MVAWGSSCELTICVRAIMINLKLTAIDEEKRKEETKGGMNKQERKEGRKEEQKQMKGTKKQKDRTNRQAKERQTSTNNKIWIHVNSKMVHNLSNCGSV